MFLRVETQWNCYSPKSQHACPGKLVVVSDRESHSITCGTCSMGINGAGPLGEFWMEKLIADGYVSQMGKRNATSRDLFYFFNTRKHRTPQELADDVLEKFEVAFK